MVRTPHGHPALTRDFKKGWRAAGMWASWAFLVGAALFPSFVLIMRLILKSMDRGAKNRGLEFIASPPSIEFYGSPFPGAADRHKQIPGFDQEIYSRSSVLCIGAGGLISHVAPTLCRKGIGRITVLDRD